jgi:hypothetical protein
VRQRHWDTPARDQWYVQTGAMFENPHGVPADEIVRFILNNPPDVVAQVVFGKYVESEGLVFTGELIKNVFDRTIPPVRSQTYVDVAAADAAPLWFKRNKNWWGQRFHTGVDFARQTDYTVLTTIDTLKMPARVVYWKRLNRVPWETIYAEVGRVRHLFGPNILADSTGPGGDVVMDALESRLYCPTHHRCNLVDSPQCIDDAGRPMGCSAKDYHSLSCVEGYDFNGPRKKQLVEHLRNILAVGYNPVGESNEFGWLRSPPIPQLEEEMAFYTWEDKKLDTDCLFSFALASWSGLEDPVARPLIGSPYGL